MLSKALVLYKLLQASPADRENPSPQYWISSQKSQAIAHLNNKQHSKGSVFRILILFPVKTRAPYDGQ